MKRRDFIRASLMTASALCAPAPFYAFAGAAGSEQDERMAWWREARFGMFIHWGIYAVLGLSEWAMHIHRIPERSYQRLARRFNPVEFDPAQWAEVARLAGMKYLVVTSKHHDGFSMFDSDLTDYNVVDATPYGRDTLAMLRDAYTDAGLRFGVYYSILDAHASGIPSFRKMRDQGFDDYVPFMKGQLQEIFEKYGPISSLFLDGDWTPQWDKERGKDLEAFIRSLQPSVIINDRLGPRECMLGDYSTPEQFIPDVPPERDWETCMTMDGASWGYHRFDRFWKSKTTLIRNLVDIASKGGNFLLNVGPDAKGRIPAPCMKRLKEVGQWMEVNGESIYGSKAGPIQGATWGKTTQKPGKVFLHVFEWPGRELTIDNFGERVSRAYALADQDRTPLAFKKNPDRISIELPASRPDPISSTIVLECPLL